MCSVQRSAVRGFKFLVVLVFLFLFACEENKVSKKSFSIAKSKSFEATIFRQNCAVCHGLEANGKEMDGRIIPSLRYGDAEKKSEQEIYDQIKNGKLPMPAFKDQLTEEEIRKMVKFIRRDLQGKDEN